MNFSDLWPYTCRLPSVRVENNNKNKNKKKKKNNNKKAQTGCMLLFCAGDRFCMVETRWRP